MAPGEALADGHAGTSTYWPATKWSAVISAPTAISLSSLDAELGQLQLRLDHGALAKWPRSALEVFLTFGAADAELQGDIAVLVLGALGDDLAAVERQDGHRHVVAGFVEEAGHAQLFGDHA